MARWTSLPNKSWRANWRPSIGSSAGPRPTPANRAWPVCWKNWNWCWSRSPTVPPNFPPTNSPRYASGSTPMACCSRSKCSARKCEPGSGMRRANWRRIVRSLREEMKNNTVGIISKWAVIVLLSLSAALPRARAAQDAAVSEDKEKAKLQRDQEREAERVYQRAKKLADKGQWEEALKAFDEASQKGGDRADGALYWKAYAQNKLNQQAEALTTLAELKKSFPDSRWLKDASALEAEIRRAGRQPPGDPGSQTDEELKLLAINSL